MTAACEQINPLLAAHAFRALDAGEAAAVDGHLAQCELCLEAYVRLGGLPILLDLAGSGDSAMEPPPLLLEAAVIAGLPQRPRRIAVDRSWRGLIGLATLGLLASSAALVSAVSAGQRDPRVRIKLAATSTRTPNAHGMAYLRARPWGTQVDLQATGLDPTRGPQIYEVWLVGANGRVSAGTFTAADAGTVSIRLGAAAHAGDFTRLGVTLEADGLDPAPRGREVLSAPLRT